MRQPALLFAVLVYCLVPSVRGEAQEPVPVDSVAAADTVAADTVAPVRLPFSPAGAFVRSLVLPGWGQAWVGSPGRGGVYFALEAGSLWMVFKSYRKLQQAEEEQEWLRQIGELDETEESRLVESRSQQFEDWLAVSIFLAFFAGADAFVSAYLADFEEHFGVEPESDGSMRLEARIPVGGHP